VAATPDPLVLSASEIGEYAFCPQAWYLRRLGAPSSGRAQVRQAEGAAAHVSIGRQADVLTSLERWQRATLALLLLVVLLTGAVWLLVGPSAP
jgi:hypothetical protein